MKAFFDWLEDMADKVEEHFPAFLRYDVVGDPASWVQHGIVCACAAFVGELLSFAILHDPRRGLHFFGLGIFVYYTVRELIQAAAHIMLDGWDEAVHIRRRDDGGLLVGWGLDGLGDLLLGPLAVLLVTW